MKKLIGLILMFFLITSCDGLRDVNYKVNVVYEIVYPDTTIRYDTIFMCRCTVKSFNNNFVNAHISSYKGTNYIRINPGAYYNEFVKTTCPIRVISFKKIEDNE